MNLKEKEVLSILSIGTFLEYFDLYLYLHFASVLNNLFFAPKDEFSTYLLTSFAYCSSYIFRPIGAILFGYIGDKYGRRQVIRITLFLMGISCLGIFYLPTYETIGVLASVMITLYRAIQGISSMGEVIGGEIYLTEFLKGKNVFTGLAIIVTMCNMACITALFGIKLSLEGLVDFRYLFLFGIVIFILGYFARRNLVESPEFIRAKNIIEYKEATQLKTWIYSLMLNCSAPVGLFIAIVGIQNIYRSSFGFSESDVVNMSLLGVICCTAYGFGTIFVSKIISPYNLAKLRISAAITTLIFMPYLLDNYGNLGVVSLLHGLICLTMCGEFHMNAIMYRNVPTLTRFKFSTLSFALSRALVAILTSLGLVVILPYCGNYTYSIFGLPFALGYLLAIRYFKALDLKNKEGLLQYYEKR